MATFSEKSSWITQPLPLASPCMDHEEPKLLPGTLLCVCWLLVSLHHPESTLEWKPLRSQAPERECGETEAKLQDKEATQGQEKRE